MDPENQTITPNLQPTMEVPPVPQTPKTNWSVSILFLILGILIGISGLWGYQKYFASSKPLAETGSSPTPIATTDPTSNWKIYTDPSGTYSFKYPTDQTVEKNANVAGLYGPDFTLFEIKPLQTKDTDPTLWWSKQTNLSGFASSCFSKEVSNSIVGAQNAILLKETGTGNECLGPSLGEVVIANYNQQLFQITDNNGVTGNQILSTFKFSGQESLNLPVSYKIPSNWTTTNIQNGVQLKSGSNSISIINIVKSPIPADSLSKWYQNISTTDLYDGSYTIEKRENITVDSTPGVKLTEKSEGPEIIRIYVYKQNFILKIELSPIDLFNQSSAQSVINSIKFTQ